eukprot:Plantae.Rhodophyta-Purpureofilum_apyrenoidigerum.ctg24468.p1 GENE.Plantae.Rhodophyta-Purpureofilum_apyrenoidigerum.ctg24468~~Plantae.Rhodophyta-Purpureofilum_apyrenoidigerum.ctg24468.p1  ORF type:complete len:423 (+),score=51.52 Plantae.Rhodophyta-Purpureofilum_apyrenoidigerum.ctg24468:192-1460(+)
MGKKQKKGKTLTFSEFASATGTDVATHGDPKLASLPQAPRAREDDGNEMRFDDRRTSGFTDRGGDDHGWQRHGPMRGEDRRGGGFDPERGGGFGSGGFGEDINWGERRGPIAADFGRGDRGGFGGGMERRDEDINWSRKGPIEADRPASRDSGRELGRERDIDWSARTGPITAVSHAPDEADEDKRDWDSVRRGQTVTTAARPERRERDIDWNTRQGPPPPQVPQPRKDEHWRESERAWSDDTEFVRRGPLEPRALPSEKLRETTPDKPEPDWTRRGPLETRPPPKAKEQTGTMEQKPQKEMVWKRGVALPRPEPGNKPLRWNVELTRDRSPRRGEANDRDAGVDNLQSAVQALSVEGGTDNETGGFLEGEAQEGLVDEQAVERLDQDPVGSEAEEEDDIHGWETAGKASRLTFTARTKLAS